MDELCEFGNMSICQRLKEIITNLFLKLSQVTALLNNSVQKKGIQHKWSDVVAGRQISEKNVMM
jgi:hypothetical protein